jgi:hypothetical protein
MSHHATLIYNAPLLRQAVLAFWRRTIGVAFPLVIAALAIGVTFLLNQGDSSWFVGALATVLFFSVVFVTVLYFVHYRNALTKFRDMGAPQASFLAEETSFTVTSGIGSSTLKWSSVIEVWRFNEFWLLLFSKAQFITLPLSSLPPEMKAFILQRIQASGGKVDG